MHGCYFSVLYSVSLIYVHPVSTPQYILKLGRVISPTLFFFKYSAIFVPLFFHTDFKNLVSVFKISCCDIDGNCVKPVSVWRKLTSLQCWVSKSKLSICLPVYLVFFDFFRHYLWFSVCKSCTCFVRFTPKYFWVFLFWAVINCLVFLILVSTYILLVYYCIET